MPHAKRTRTLEGVLSRCRAKLTAWQVRALFLGAQTSTNLRLGPQHLMDRIFGPEPILGKDLNDANANIQALMKAWNELVTAREAGPVRLSKMRRSDPPDVAELDALAQRRAEEIIWFTRGIDAGGDDPKDFGPEGEELFRKLAEGSAFLVAYRDLFRRTPEESPRAMKKTRESLDQLTRTMELMISDLMTISDGVRRRAAEEMRRGWADRRTGPRQSVKVGRNEPCPCGSGRKWKRCCGASTAH
jgi:hypothetical protein